MQKREAKEIGRGDTVQGLNIGHWFLTDLGLKPRLLIHEFQPLVSYTTGAPIMSCPHGGGSKNSALPAPQGSESSSIQLLLQGPGVPAVTRWDPSPEVSAPTL